MAITSLPDRATDTRPRRRRTSTLLVLAVLAVLGVGAVLGAVNRTRPDAPPVASPPSRLVDSVGRIEGSTALVAVLAVDAEVSAYVCDGDTATGERFSGTLLDDRAVLRSAGGAQLTVDLTDEGATGTFTPADGTAPALFRTTPSTGAAGWYTAEAPAADGTATADWVVLADGTQTGVQTTHKHKRKGHHLHPKPTKPGKPGGVSPKPSDPTSEPEQSIALGELNGCVKFEGRLCVSREAADPVELDDDTTVLPGRVLADGLPPLTGGEGSLAPN